MTEIAIRRGMCPGQREIRSLMAKGSRRPTLGPVAIAACFTQATLMRFVVGMADRAAAFGVAMRLPLQVARATGRSLVCTLEEKIGCSVIESLGSKTDDIRLATAMLGMTRLALCLPSLFLPAMKASTEPDISRDLFMTYEAEVPLRTTVKGTVATLAILLDFHMCGCDRGRHDQRLEIRRICETRRPSKEEEGKDPNPKNRAHPAGRRGIQGSGLNTCELP